jgi:hypothetical protein
MARTWRISPFTGEGATPDKARPARATESEHGPDVQLRVP